MEPERWLTMLVSELAGADPSGARPAERSSSEVPSTEGVVSEGERAALLDLARIAAHGSERWTAPISTYLAGLALAGIDADERAQVLRELVARLE